MKLVFISHDDKCTGGAQMCLLSLLKGIRQSHPDWEIYMIFPGNGDFLKACSPYLTGYKLVEMKWWLVKAGEYTKLKDKIIYVYELMMRSFKIMRYLRRIKPDYGVTNTIALPHLAIACRLLNIKHSWFIHEIPNDTWNELHFVFPYRFVLKCIDKLSGKVLVTSEYAQCYYRTHLTASKVCVVIQAVELDHADVNAPGRVRKVPERYNLLLVGTFDSNKGQSELLQAVKQMVEKGQKVSCRLVGNDSGFMQRCREYVEDNDLKGVVEIIHFDKHVKAYYEAADVLLVCSALETFCRVAVEALMCKLPVIVSDVGANPERIEEGVNGLLYQKGNIPDLVEKIEILSNESVRKQYIANIDSAAIKEKYSTYNFASDFVFKLGLDGNRQSK